MMKSQNSIGQTPLQLILFLVLSFCLTGSADDSKSGKVNWEQAYQKLLKDRPNIRKKVERGDATKEQVLEWLKNGGNAQRKEKYYGKNVELKDPDTFRPADGKVIYSGPQPGEILPPLKVIGVTGALKGLQYDPVERAQGRPHLLIFQDTSGSSLKGLYFLGPVLDRIIEKSKSNLQVSVVLLSNDRSSLNLSQVEFYQQTGKNLQFSHSLDGREGPGAYGLNRHVDVTVIVAKNGEVLHNLVFPSPVFVADPHVLGAVAEVIEQDRQRVASWFVESD